MSEDNKRLVRRLVHEIWNRGNLNLAEELIAPDYVRHDPSWPEEIQGQEGFKEYASIVRRAFSDGQLTIEDLIAEGDRAVLRWTMRGTHQGEFLGIPPTFRDLTLTGVTIYRIEGGRVAEAWDGYDALGIMQRLGVVP